MSYWEKFKASMRRFMQGRNGSDELSFALLIAALVLTLLSSFAGALLSGIFSLLSMVAYVICLFRMFSRNVQKRYAENQLYLKKRQQLRTTGKQSWTRLKNLPKYKYFKCPECHSLLRLPRKVGEVTVTCGKCRHSFKKKA